MRKIMTLLVGFTSTVASAQDCGGYVGQTVTPSSINRVLEGFSKLNPKGEFETTAQFEARKATTLAGMSGALIIQKEPEDRKHFEYDADAQKLRIISYAFHNTGLNSDAVLGYGGSLYEKVPTSYSNYEVVISQTDKPTGTYEGTNSYGAKADIIKIERTTKGIFDRKGDIGKHSLFPAADEKPYVVGELALSPAEAQRLKPLLKLAFVVVPKEPFIGSGTDGVGKVTVQNPRDITEKVTLMIADIQCGLVLDPSNAVLGSYPTR